MRFFFLFAPLIVTTTTLHADILRSQIHSIYDGGENETSFLRLSNGRVIFLNQKYKKNRDVFEFNREVELVTDKDNNLISIQSIDRPDHSSFTEEAKNVTPERPDFEPTIIKSKDEALSIFKRFNSNYQRVSQCFNRAHIWAYDEYRNQQINSLKGWVFFTASYINRNRFLWWFHVAPMFMVKNHDTIEPMVMDFRYSDRPQRIKEWTDLFVYSKRPCKVTTKFSEYDINPQTEDCYWITTPMYYWQPTDIQNEELQGKYLIDFNKSSIKAAFKEAFHP